MHIAHINENSQAKPAVLLPVPEIEVTNKGFLFLTLSFAHCLKLGGHAICDSCNSGAFEGKFIGALNRWYCQTCFDEWDKKAVFYDEDVSYEKLAISRVLSMLK